MRLGAGCGVAADDAGSASAQAQALEQGQSEALSFVGHHAPGQALLIEAVEQFGHAVEQPRIDADLGGVELENLQPERLVALVPRVQAESDFEQAAGTAGSIG